MTDDPPRTPTRPGTPGEPPWPPPRRSLALPGTLAAMLAIGIAAGAYMLWHTPLPPDADPGGRCARAFDARLRTARGGTDDDLVALSDQALAARCARHAYEAVAAVDPEASEAAAWRLARFHDPGEAAPAYREAGEVAPARAAAAYLAWAPRSARMAEGLRRLCATESAALDDDPALKRGCGR